MPPISNKIGIPGSSDIIFVQQSITAMTTTLQLSITNNIDDNNTAARNGHEE
uniref:Uncharacterized protein n=1 Tax=Rhizophora mucronata TaxID=61149 RepID=A0A2P2QGY3_RHIMU